MHIKWGKHLSEPFHYTNGVRQGGIESILVYRIFRWFIQPNNTKPGCYIGEASRKHLMFADDIRVHPVADTMWTNLIFG